MDSKNIAICVAPSLIRINSISSNSIPLSNISNKESHAVSPNQLKEATELVQKQCQASIDCVALMIENNQKIFQVPKNALFKIDSKNFEYPSPILMRERVERMKSQRSSEKESLRSYLQERIDENLKVFDS